MRRRGLLSPIERGVAVTLSLAWLGAGAVALWVSLVHSRWGLAILASGAIAFGTVWLRVAAAARLMTWAELAGLRSGGGP